MLTGNMLAADLDTLKKYYDVARIVEPALGCADGSRIYANEPIKQQGEEVCRHFGHKGRQCNSCLCLQAIENNETFVKTEVLDGNIYMVTAMPLKKEGRMVALELIKLISERTIGLLTELPQENTRLYHSIAKLHDWATKDALTDIYNRRFIDERLPKAMKKAKQQCEPFSIVMADIDWFKLINDRYGHGVGDEILKSFAATIENNIRSDNGDWVARYGGEEFLIFLDNCSDKGAYKVTEKLRRIIEQTQLFTKAGVLHITASFGIHTFGKRDETLQQLMERADRNLYQAKQSGRNCTIAEYVPTRSEVSCRENCKYAK
ncbi:GGDEF domain-containing protein [Azotosporobacter soli]|uniref:GGDEF domain-containing protein n=1 Tax=Azotosporobacter soli TaxID=3055040 RepID=UPI0031FE6E1A